MQGCSRAAAYVSPIVNAELAIGIQGCCWSLPSQKKQTKKMFWTIKETFWYFLYCLKLFLNNKGNLNVSCLRPFDHYIFNFTHRVWVTESVKTKIPMTVPEHDLRPGHCNQCISWSASWQHAEELQGVGARLILYRTQTARDRLQRPNY